MSTAVIIVLAVIVVVLAGGALYAARGSSWSGGGGRRLRRRFGPEYDRVLARHGGDTRAAGRELGARLARHGSLAPRPLPSAERERYARGWAGAQERFVDSPRQALTEAAQLLAGLARARGFPGPERYDDHVDALSVHHPDHVDGYRRLHAAARGEVTGTEEMRKALLRARTLFEALTAEGARGSLRRSGRAAREGRPGPAERGRTRPNGQAKGSEAS